MLLVDSDIFKERRCSALELKEKIKKLTNAFPALDEEDDLSRVAAQLLEPYVDTVEVDVFGNVFGYKSCGIRDAQALLLAASVNRSNFRVAQVTGEGFLRLVGADANQQLFPGSELLIKTQSHGIIPGVAVVLPPYLQKPEEDIPEMILDIGMAGERAKSVVRVGDPVVYAHDAYELADDMICGKAIGGRACYAAVLHAMELLQGAELKVNLVVAGIAGDERRSFGAMTASRFPESLCAVAVDTCGAKAGGTASPFVGGGPVIALGVGSRPRLAGQVAAVARTKELPYQVRADAGFSGGSSGLIYSAVEAGICTTILSLPLRYPNSPVEMLQVRDIENTGRLVAEFAKAFDGRI